MKHVFLATSSSVFLFMVGCGKSQFAAKPAEKDAAQTTQQTEKSPAASTNAEANPKPAEKEIVEQSKDTKPATECEGVSVGGFCWHLFDDYKSCEAHCTNFGGANDAATINFAGSAGTLANCSAIWNAHQKKLGGPAITVTDYSGNKGNGEQNYGCGGAYGIGAARFSVGPTNPKYAVSNSYGGGIFTRFCACER